MGLVLEILGDVDVSSITHKDMRKFMDTLIRLPSNKSKKFPGVSVGELFKRKHKQTMAPRTVSKVLSRVASLFNFGLRHGYMVRNPATGLQIKIEGRANKEREPYEIEDLQRLLRVPLHGEPQAHTAPLLDTFDRDVLRNAPQ